MKKFTIARGARFTAALYLLAVAGTLSLASSCNKGNKMCDKKKHTQVAHTEAMNTTTSSTSGRLPTYAKHRTVLAAK